MFRQRRIRGGWTAFIIISVLLMINCGGGGGGGDNNGTATTYSISGTVTSNSVPLPSVTVRLTDAASASTFTTTDAGGNYQFTGLSGGDYTVIPPSVPGYGFTPGNRLVAVSADMTGQDFDATPNTAWAWGRNVDGQIGDGSTTERDSPVQVVLNLTGPQYLTEVVSVSCGWQHTLALRADGTVWTWGSNNFGQLGVDPSTTPQSDVPVQVQGLTGVTAIAAGNLHSLAILDDGTVRAWGLNNFGQLGNGNFDNSTVPVTVSNLTDVIAIAAGDFFSLALLSDGTVWGWGDGGNGRLGPSNPGSNVPVQVQGLTGTMTAIACGHRYSLAVRSDGTVWTWGENFSGQLGRDTGGVDSSAPGQVMTITGVFAIAGGEYHTIAVKSDGTVWAWGSNDNGQLGIGLLPVQSNDALQVTGLSGVAAVAAGSYHSVAIGSNGSVWTWGQNIDGQLGDGGTAQRNTPFQVPGLNNINKLAAGLSHTAAVKSP